MADKNKKKGLARKIQDFLASYQGKVTLNYAYSWGAAVVILGALFKLTHLPGANFMLFVGMGTEVLVFFISAFDRPFKTYKWESVFPNIKISGADYGKKKEEETVPEGDAEAEPSAGEDVSGMEAVLQAQGMQGQPGAFQGGGISGPIVIGGMGGGVVGVSSEGEASAAGSPGVVGGGFGAPVQGGAPVSGGGTVVPGGMAGAGPQVISVGAPAPAAPVVPGVEVSEEMEEATKAYLEQLKEMTDALSRFVEQTQSMGKDAEQINTLNKNLTGINAIYEIQLRSISSQLSTIDEINAQSRKMASQIDELNKVYARMLEAMTVNMKATGAANV